MAIDPTTGMPAPIKAAVVNQDKATAKDGSAVNTQALASNFQTFLTLLTTQLQNQSPLDPLDTNQFTAQLVQFSQVEQQLKMNDQLSALVSLQETAQQTQALGYIGATVSVDGSTAELKDSYAAWNFKVSKPSSATVTITNTSGATVYSGTFPMQAGEQEFKWDGHGNNGTAWPDGTYKMTVTATDALGQPVAVSTEVQGVVDEVDVGTNPPVLTINGDQYTLDKIRRIVRPS